MLWFFFDEKKLTLITIKMSSRRMTCLCRDPKDVPTVMCTKFPTNVMFLRVEGNKRDVVAHHLFPRGLGVNGVDYKEVFKRVVKRWIASVSIGRSHSY